MVSGPVRVTQHKTRVTFSPSTLHRELEHGTGRAASLNPFLNFLAEVRRKAKGNRHHGNPLKVTTHLWKNMSDDEKEPYRTTAIEDKKTLKENER